MILSRHLRHKLLLAVAISTLVACGGGGSGSDDSSADSAATNPESTPVVETGTPGTESPVAETPVTETPVTQTPVAETPATDTPVTQTPVAETPATDTPVTQTPVAQTPGTETPVTQTPVAQTPGTGTGTPSPSPAPVVLRVLGNTTWSWGSADGSEEIRQTVANSMNQLANLYSTLSTFNIHFRVRYSSGVPTAQANYNGTITFGGQRNLRVALHESLHYLGVGQVSQWSRSFLNGAWTGATATARVKAYDGETATVRGDSAHYWPYGMNQDSEFGPVRASRTIYMLGALRADMQLRDLFGFDGTSGTPGTFRLVNRASGLLLEDIDGAEGGSIDETTSNTAQSQKWNFSFDNGYVTFTNGVSGRYLSGSAAQALLTSAQTGVNTDRHWEMQVTDNGYFRLVNRIGRNCLTGGNTTGSEAVVIGPCSGQAAEWHLAD